MNRRNGMWLTILCILAAGIFTRYPASTISPGKHPYRKLP